MNYILSPLPPSLPPSPPPLSAAIMKYIVTKYQLPDHWYPADMCKRVKIDEYLSWHTGNLRMGAAGYMFMKVIGYLIHCLLNFCHTFWVNLIVY